MLIVVANRQLTAVACSSEGESVQPCHIRDQNLDSATIPTYIRQKLQQQVIQYQSLVYLGLCVHVQLCASHPDGFPL